LPQPPSSIASIKAGTINRPKNPLSLRLTADLLLLFTLEYKLNYFLSVLVPLFPKAGITFDIPPQL
jgi:hypothetical protein